MRGVAKLGINFERFLQVCSILLQSPRRADYGGSRVTSVSIAESHGGPQSDVVECIPSCSLGTQGPSFSPFITRELRLPWFYHGARKLDLVMPRFSLPPKGLGFA